MDAVRALKWDTFQAYSPLHLATVLLCVAVVACVAAAGLAARNTPAEPRLRLAIVAASLAAWSAYTVWWNWDGIDFLVGLPLHICDVGGLVAPFALLTGRRWLRATLYFWTFALTVQAYIQPVVQVGPSTFEFWGFWVTHTIIVLCAVYDLIVLRFRPLRSDLSIALTITLLYGAAMTPLNLMLGANYGYIGDPAFGVKRPAIFDLLGPWPFRAFVIAALAALAFCVVYAPWSVVRRGRRESGVGAGQGNPSPRSLERLVRASGMTAPRPPTATGRRSTQLRRGRTAR